MENTRIEAGTEDLMAKNFRGRAYLIVGFLLTEGMVWGFEESRQLAWPLRMPIELSNVVYATRRVASS